MTPENRPDAVTWLGHATCVIDVGGVRFVTDPLLGRHAGVLRRRDALAPEPRHWHGSAAALVSHLHHDHAHLGSLRSVGAVALSAPANARWLEQHGVPAHHLGPDDWWSPDGAPHVRVRTAHAVHGHRPMPHRPNAATGFLVVSDGVARDGSPRTTRVWFAGDTEAYPAMAQLDELAGGPIDLALVPIGGWGPRLSGGHLDPVQAARVCRTVGAARAVPIHWGTLHAPLGQHLPRGWMDRGGEAFVAAVRREAPDCEPVLLQPGDAVAL
ncbi:hypothetical protein C8046_09215 [Serinibacter arcticus]|uniref:Metallo-beta-lactamase domain-containing protein n=1 Tax=Serinibacter arcticus TaxID=1655435 RepID=A0A2U1ZV00_9MICO|nr:MBL fold metallo-hydrolase [Serinibacter arcticus]PWD50799.1 hypothetical protein C8046_09215 [Serinibacter arcticus]